MTSMYVEQPVYAQRGLPEPPIKDFSRDATPIRFVVDGDVFEATHELSALDALLVTELLQTFDQPELAALERFDVLTKFLTTALLPSSAERFVERLSSRTEPIGFDRMLAIVTWLVQRYRGADSEETP